MNLNLKPQYHEYTRTIPANGGSELVATGSFFACLEATGLFKIAFDNGSKTLFRKGLEYRTPEIPFGKVYLFNESDGDVTVTVCVGAGGISDNRFVAEGKIDTSAVSANQLVSPAPTSIGAGASVQIAGSDPSRKEVIVKNMANTEFIWVNGGEMAAEGIPLEGGEGLVLTTTDAVHVYNPNGIAVSVASMSVRNG